MQINNMLRSSLSFERRTKKLDQKKNHVLNIFFFAQIELIRKLHRRTIQLQ